MADSPSDNSLDSSLNDISRDLDSYCEHFTLHNARLAAGVAVRRSLGDADKCNRDLKKHRSTLQTIIESNRQGAVVVARDGIAEDEVDNTAEAFSAPDNFMSGCASPDTIAEVNSILMTFDACVKNLKTLSTAAFEDCTDLFNCSREYVDDQKEKCRKITEGKNKLSQIIKTYLSTLIATVEQNIERTGVGEERRRSISIDSDLLLEIIKRLRESLDGLSLLDKEASTLIEVLNDLDKKVIEKDKKGETLWFNGDAEMYPYFINESVDGSAHKQLLCWVRADRKTMRRSMLTCGLAEQDEITFDMRAGEVFLSDPITLTSKGGKVLKANETKICIFIPYKPVPTDKEKEITVLITDERHKPCQLAENKEVVHEGEPCILIERDRLSYLVVLILFGPILYEKEIGQNGGTIAPKTDDSIKMDIPPGALSEDTRVGIQSIPELALPIGLVQAFFSGLAATSSMVYPKLPQQMSKPAEVKMNISNPSEDEQLIHAVVNSNDGWSVQPLRRSLSSIGSFHVPVTSDAKQLIIINTSKEVSNEEVKKVAEAITEAIEEAVVNFVVMQNDLDQHQLYIECCKKEYTAEHVNRMKEMNFHEVSTFQDIYLKEHALIKVSCTNSIVLDLPRGKTEFDIYFLAELSRHAEVYIKPEDDNPPPGTTFRGYIEFQADRKDVGIHEIKLRRCEESTETKLDLCNIPIALKTEKEEDVQNEDRKRKFEQLMECADEIDKLLSKNDLVKLSKTLQVRSKRNMKSVKDILKLWFPSSRIADDKLSDLSRALRNIDKDAAAQIVDTFVDNSTEEAKFLNVIKYLANDAHVLQQNKIFLLTLGLNEADYVELEHTYSKSLRGMLTNGLLLWKSKLGKKATMTALVKELRSLKLIRAAEWLEQEIRSPSAQQSTRSK